MKTSNDDYGVVENEVKYGIRKFSQQGATNVFVNQQVLFRATPDRRKTGINCAQKFQVVVKK